MQELPQLKLENQICFPIYAAHRLMTQQYQPLLEELDITYPQYLILLVLWEHAQMPVTGFGKLLHLTTNTLTPLLKRLEAKGLVKRSRSNSDERVVLVSLTDAGIALRDRAKEVPMRLIEGIGGEFSLDEAIQLKNHLESLIDSMTSGQAPGN